jgi:hypothetical protein
MKATTRSVLGAREQHGDGDDPDGLPALLKRTEKAVGGTPKRGIDEKKLKEVAGKFLKDTPARFGKSTC